MLASRQPHLQQDPSPGVVAPALALVLAAFSGLCLACASDPAVATISRAGLARETASAALQASAVGIAGADDDFSPESDPDFDWSDDEDDSLLSPEAHLGPHLKAGLSRMVRRLRSVGQLSDTDWQAGTSPPSDQTYARINVGDDLGGLNPDDDDIVLDGFRTDAWVPVDADGHLAGDNVYMVKIGGIAGWQFTAGPFSLPHTDGIELGLEDHGQPLCVPAGSRLVLHLPYNRVAGHPWAASGDALVPTSTEVEAATQEMVLRYDLGDTDPGLYRLALSRQSADSRDGPQFCVPLTITTPDDDAAPYGLGTW